MSPYYIYKTANGWMVTWIKMNGCVVSHGPDATLSMMTFHDTHALLRYLKTELLSWDSSTASDEISDALEVQERAGQAEDERGQE